MAHLRGSSPTASQSSGSSCANRWTRSSRRSMPSWAPLRARNRHLLVGNGGSAADAQPHRCRVRRLLQNRARAAAGDRIIDGRQLAQSRPSRGRPAPAPGGLYTKLWRPYDDEPAEAGTKGPEQFWKREEKQGGFKRPRLDLFFQHYLTYQTGERRQRRSPLLLISPMVGSRRAQGPSRAKRVSQIQRSVPPVRRALPRFARKSLRSPFEGAGRQQSVPCVAAC